MRRIVANRSEGASLALRSFGFHLGSGYQRDPAGFWSSMALWIPSVAVAVMAETPTAQSDSVDLQFSGRCLPSTARLPREQRLAPFSQKDECHCSVRARILSTWRRDRIYSGTPPGGIHE